MSTRRIEWTRVCDLSAGGMATLTLIVQPNGKQLVHRELLRRNLFRWRIRRGFVNGTRIREKLSEHPNIVQSLEHGTAKFVPYEIIEYVQGHNLRKLINDRHAIVKERSLALLRSAAAALAHVHKNGIIHLDVKAENFLVSLDGDEPELKLTDFDLSIESDGKRTRHRAGTEAYMAPEQLRGGCLLSPAADMFAFGVMAYNLVTRRMPFHGKTARERRVRQVSRSYKLKPPQELNKQLSPKLGRIIMQCLEKDPNKRLPSMSYLCQELSKI